MLRDSQMLNEKTKSMQFLKSYTPLALLMFLMIGLLVPACKDDNPVVTADTKSVKTYDYKVAYDWNEMFLQVERYAAGYRPGPAPRSLAYMGLSAYEACVSGMPEYQSVANLYNGLNIPEAGNQEYHWPTVINASYAYLMPRFFPNAADNLRQKMIALENQYNDKGEAAVSPEVFERRRTGAPP